MAVQKELIFMEHDGGIDDLLSLMLLLCMDDKELLGINVTPADCYLEPAIESTYKILQLFGKENIAIGRSDCCPVNAFPSAWRASPMIVNALPLLINLKTPKNLYDMPEASHLLIKKLSEATQKVTIIMTGPCSNLVKALKTAPEIKNKIEKIVWMAGAFKTNGNVQTYMHNGTAEWNVFWDPISSKELFEMALPLICIPLDVTNNVPVTKDFLSVLAKQSEIPLSNLAGQLWASTLDTIPGYYYTYFMWDILASSYLAIPHEFTVEKVKAVVCLNPPNAGQTMIDKEGYYVEIATHINKNIFYNYILEQFKKIPPL